MKKLYALALPILAVAAFAIAPSVAAAQQSYGTCAVGTPHSANCPTASTEHFTEFPGEARVGVNGIKVGTGEFILEAEKENVGLGIGIKCSVIDFVGKFWNVGGIGHSHLILVFEKCKVFGKELEEKCGANLINGNEIIEGVVTDEVTKANPAAQVTVTIESGFGVKCGAVNLGSVTGTATGSQAEKSATLKFAQAKGLTFAGKPSTITGEVEFVTISGSKKVYI